MFRILNASKFKRRIRCVSLNNQPFQARPTLANTNSNETLFYLIIASVNNVVEVIILFMIYMLEYVFQIK